MKKLLAIILALACCLSLAACASPEETNPLPTQQVTEPPAVSATQAATEPSATIATQAPTDPTQATQPPVTQPRQKMCYWCDDYPVTEDESYCVNCRCLKCYKPRKEIGRYLYCREHNCNETNCEYPAFDDSQYCSEHKCSKPNCDNRRWSGSEYCAHHK